MPEMEISFLGTGSGTSIYRAHTAIAVVCPDGTRLLLDASSGNSVLRNGAQLGMDGADFGQVLLTHHHPDHMSGLIFLQFHRAQALQEESPLLVYGTGEALDGLRRHCLNTRLNVTDIDGNSGRNHEGREVLRWQEATADQPLELGPKTVAWTFPVNHISGAVGWRVESDGVSLVFSGDTRYSRSLVDASQGTDILIHEALCTDDDQALADSRAHATAGEAARSAAQAGASRLALTHIGNPFHANTQPLADEASRFYNGPVAVAHDLLQITVAG